MSRGGPKITRSDYRDNSNWLDSFADNLNKSEAAKPTTATTAVEAARQRDQRSLLDQISSIVGGKSMHSSVESAVQEMQERTGLKEYLRRQSSEGSASKKTASSEIFQNLNKDMRDNIIQFIKNRVETHRGLVALPALQEEILGTFKRDGVQPQDVDNQEVANFINQLIIEELKKSPVTNTSNMNIGKGVGITDMDSNDDNNSDFFKGLLPTKGS